MAPKSSVSYLCAECGDTFSKWSGRCPSCGAWNSLSEFREPKLPTGTSGSLLKSGAPTEIRGIREIEADLSAPRRSSGLGEVDRALGGGFLPGQVVLLSGEPGAGKSTLLLQVAASVGNSPSPLAGEGGPMEQSSSFPSPISGEGGPKGRERVWPDEGLEADTKTSGSSPAAPPLSSRKAARTPPRGGSVLYLSGEESLSQVALRAHRLGLADAGIRLGSETSLEGAIAAIQSERPNFVVIDSIQTLSSSSIDGVAGGPAQLKFATLALTELAKQTGFTLVLVGQVTKDGVVAGPQMIAHAVDTVLSLEGDRSAGFRLLRAVKNRFGATDEVGVLEMTEAGLRSVENPSKLLLDGRANAAPGSVVTALAEGTRILLTEVQALTVKSAFSAPVRRASGLASDRVPLLLAVLQKHGGLRLEDQDVFVNAVGGLGVRERAADLGIILAVASSFLGKPLPPDLLVVGEVGLSGEVRSVPMLDAWIREAQKLGFRKILCPLGARKAEGVYPIENVAGAVARLRELQ